MKDAPLVSIIVACYNVEAYITTCLESLLGQTYTALEVLVVNDGSTDATLSRVTTIASRDARVRVFNQTNQGVSASRNFGITMATGDFVLFVDGDDWLSLDTLAVLQPYFYTYDLVCFSYYKEFASIQTVRTFALPSDCTPAFFQRRLTGLVGSELSDPGQLDSLSTVWGKLYLRSILTSHPLSFVGLDAIGTWEDGLFNWDYLQYVTRIKIIDAPYYHYRKDNVHSITSKPIVDFYSKRLHLFTLLEERLQLHSKDSHYFEALHNRISLSIIGVGLVVLNQKSSFLAQYRSLRSVLGSPFYTKCIAGLSLRYFPLHWKLFFFFAKKRVVLPLLLLLYGIQSILKK